MFRRGFFAFSLLLSLLACFIMGGTAFAATLSTHPDLTIIGAGDCGSSYNFFVYSLDHTDERCGIGTGYRALTLHDVNQIDNDGSLDMWILYTHYGHPAYCTIAPGTSTVFGPDPTHVTVSEFYYGASRGSACPLP